MVTFTPPAGFRDVTEYTFVFGERRVVVRHAVGPGRPTDLELAAREYAVGQREIAGADAVVSQVQSRRDGVPYLTVTSTFRGPDGRAVVESSAFVLLLTGVTAHLALTAPAEDAAAPAEFRGLIDAVRPAVTAPATRTLGGPGAGASQVGPVWVDLPVGYRDVTTFTFREPEGPRWLTVRAAAGGLIPPAGLFGPLSEAEDDRGRRFAYEHPAAAATRAAGPAAATEIRDVGGQSVVVEARGAAGDPALLALAAEVLDSARARR